MRTELIALVGMELRSSTNKGVSNTVWGYAPDRGEVITFTNHSTSFYTYYRF